MRVDGTLYYLLKDHLGSASVVTDSSGDIVGEQRYYPFGETRWTSGNMFTDRLYTGQREMTDLGLYHYGARFYEPKLGRFISADTIVPDPADPQNWNRYSYTFNNPIKYIDPDGHDPIILTGIALATLFAIGYGAVLYSYDPNFRRSADFVAESVVDSVENWQHTDRWNRREAERTDKIVKPMEERATKTGGTGNGLSPKGKCTDSIEKFTGCAVAVGITVSFLIKMATSGANGESEAISDIRVSDTPTSTPTSTSTRTPTSTPTRTPTPILSRWEYRLQRKGLLE